MLKILTLKKGLLFDEQTTAYHMNICNIGDKECFANLLYPG